MRVVVIKNVTGNAYTYGLVSVGEDKSSYSVTTDTTAGTGAVTVSSFSGAQSVLLPVQGPYGGLAIGSGYARAYNKLTKEGAVSLDAFEGTRTVRVDGKSLSIAEKVQVYNESTKRFITLQQAKQDFTSFEIYTDATAGIVRLVVVK